jgi:hypothetical protein
MTIEQLLTDALKGADEYQPSPDLFAKVQRSIEEDAAHRRRVGRTFLLAAGGLAVAMAWVAAFLEIGDGTVTIPWWTLEILTTAIMIVVVVGLGPLIRRFGTDLTSEVFRSNRETSGRFLALLDIAYYLVFAAFVLMTTSLSAPSEWSGRLGPLVEHELARIGGLLLVMGILHALTIASLPVMGLVFASNWRRADRNALGAGAPEPAPGAERADRVATIIVWVVAAVLALQVILFLVPALLGLILGAE